MKFALQTALIATGLLGIATSSFAADLETTSVALVKEVDGYHVFVKIKNTGATVGPFYVDLFEGADAAPQIGQFGDQFQQVPWLSGDGKPIVVEFVIDVLPDNGFLDVLLDTDKWIDETNENNNGYEYRI